MFRAAIVKKVVLAALGFNAVCVTFLKSTEIVEKKHVVNK